MVVLFKEVKGVCKALHGHRQYRTVTGELLTPYCPQTVPPQYRGQVQCLVSVACIREYRGWYSPLHLWYVHTSTGESIAPSVFGLYARVHVYLCIQPKDTSGYTTPVLTCTANRHKWQYQPLYSRVQATDTRGYIAYVLVYTAYRHKGLYNPCTHVYSPQTQGPILPPVLACTTHRHRGGAILPPVHMCTARRYKGLNCPLYWGSTVYGHEGL